MPNPVEIKVNAGDLRKLYVDLKAAEGNFTRELRNGVRKAAQPMVVAVRDAASFSSRIPATVRAKVSFSASSTSVTIVAGGQGAPHAAPINNKGRSGSFRHPVYPDPSKDRSQWTWVDQTAIPFFQPPIRSHEHEAEQVILHVMDDVARKAGFR